MQLLSRGHCRCSRQEEVRCWFYKECVTLLVAAHVQLTDKNLDLVFTHCIISLNNYLSSLFVIIALINISVFYIPDLLTVS